MVNYIQFYTRLLNGEIDEAIASDGVCPLDGRLSLDNMIDVGYSQAYSLRKLHKFVGFIVMRGTYSTGSPCTKMQYLDYEAMEKWRKWDEV